MRTADLVVVLDLAVRRGSATSRVRACHSLQGRQVHVLRVTGDDVTRDSIDVRDWHAELGRVCRVPVRTDAPPPPEARLDLPWDLVVGTGVARSRHRPDLAAALLARLDAPLRGQVDQLLVSAVGRLRAVGMHPSRRRIGVVSWLLFADGWRALTPHLGAGVNGPRAMLRLEPRAPEDLGREVARWMTRW
jgi:hypothetical protein